MSKIIIYAHDTFGLGHVNRIINIANKLAENRDNRILLITGSKALSIFDIDKGIDVVKLPCIIRDVSKKDNKGFIADIGTDCSTEIFQLRREILRNSMAIFNPDIFLVDHSPLGPKRELMEILVYLRSITTKKVKIYLGQRDIYCEKSRFKKIWHKHHLEYVIKNYYDKVFIYGQKNLFNYLEYYKIPKYLHSKFKFLGYIVNPEKFPKKDRKKILINVMVGGGRDGYEVINNVIKAVCQLRKKLNIDLLVNTGPLMDKNQYNKIKANKWIICKQFLYKTKKHITNCDLLISMGGYNTVCELVDTDTPAIIIPRSKPDQEQLIRAMVMKRKGLLDYISPEDLSVNKIKKKILLQLKNDKRKIQIRREVIKFTGLNNIKKEIDGK